MSVPTQLYLVTPAVYASVIMGGGYGTGREVVEYFTSLGPKGGLLAIAVSALVFLAILYVTFELARLWQAHDYRSFFRRLLGRGWWLFEVLYVALFILVVGVVGAAAGALLQDQIGVPARYATAAIFLVALIVLFFGRSAVERMLTVWTALMFAVFAAYLLTIGVDFTVLAEDQGEATGWLQSGLLYAGYNAAVLPVLLFTVRGLQRPAQSLITAALTSLAICLPALMFHLSYMRGLPAVLDEALPNYFMITAYGGTWLVVLFSIALVGTLIETVTGLVQGIIERVAHGVEDALQPLRRLGLAVVLLAAGALASEVGVVPLIAAGYSAMGIGFLLVYVLPALARYALVAVRGDG